MCELYKDLRVKVTSEQWKKVMSGEAELCGMIKDSTNKTVLGHLPLVDQDQIKEVSDQVNIPELPAETTDISKYSNAGIGKGILIGLGISAFVAAGAAITYKIVKHKQKKKEKELNAKEQAKQLTHDYNKNAFNYIYKADKGTLTYSDIKSFSEKYSEVMNYYKIGDIKIELSEEQVDVLYEIVYKLTMQLIEKTGYQIENKELLIEAPSKSKEQKMEDIKEYVYIQRKICEEDK